MTRKIGLWGLLAVLALPGAIPGQETTWRAQAPRGWIGLSVLYTTGVLEGEETTVVVIDEVAEGSPAESAGIQVGDTLTHLDGQPVSQSVLTSLHRTIEVGDLVRLTILRDGRPREVLVEAATEAPDRWILESNAGQVAIRLDSVRGAILQNLDSLRLSIAGLKVDSAGDFSIRILRPEARTEREAWLNLTYTLRGMEADSLHVSHPEVFVFEPAFSVPFEAIVMGSQETLLLRGRLQALRGELTEARRQELARIREIEASIPGPTEEFISRDTRVREIREREAALSEEIAQLNRQLERATQTAMSRQLSEVQARQQEALARAREVMIEPEERRSAAARDSLARVRERALQQEYERRRPQNYIIAGQSFVAGAQLKPLNPDLATYFNVSEGVLVTEVLDGTPAAMAGMMAGDVIVRVGGEKVASLDDLRFGIGYFERPLRLRVVRKGEEVEIVIR